VLPAAFGFVVVFRVKIYCAESIQDTELLAPFHVLGKCGGHGFSLGLVPADTSSLFDQSVIQCQVGCHVCIFTHIDV